jgi:hypothetical protein
MAIGKRSQEGDRDKPWHKSAANFLAVDAILAAVAALVVQMLDQETPQPCAVWFVFGALAIFLFILDAEKMSEAFVEDDFKMYVRYQLVYNAAVLLVLIVLARVLDHYCRAPICYLVVASVVLCWFPFWGTGRCEVRRALP